MVEARLTIQELDRGALPYIMVELQNKKGKCYAVRLQAQRLKKQPYLLLGTLARVYGEMTNEMVS